MDLQWRNEMKRLCSCVLFFLMMFAVFAEETFKPLDFVQLPKGEYIQGEDTESFPEHAKSMPLQ